MKKKDNSTILMIISLILLVIFGLMHFLDHNEENVNNKEVEYKLLNDYSRFFTIDSCVYKYITYVSNSKTEDILKVLDSNYVRDNNINSTNLYNYEGTLEGSYTFKTKKIYYEILNNNYIRYYVYGYLIQDSLDSIGKKEDYYVIVNLDSKNQLFSITPYDGTIFKEVR